MSRIIAIIPARYGSTRFPGKPLHSLAGKPLIQRVWERCMACTGLARVLIATDDERILRAAEAFGAEACLTSPDHPSGTDRIAEAAARDPEATHIINVQGDEPILSPTLIDELAARLAADASIGMITAVHPLHDPALLHDPNVVKAVLDKSGRALYFSRSPLPFPRNPQPDFPVWRHMGLYGYSREFLDTFVAWPPSPLELTEGLEQLRALENGARIHCVVTHHDSPGVDTPEQAADMERRLRAMEADTPERKI
ncbi:MAG: 3-deoxy-manno-octulosonate cytidylyltransferase [Verrucomicrobiota bacterium]